MRVVFVALVVASAASASAGSLHVSTAGSDSGPGTPNQPLRTLQRAADLVSPGDTVLVAPGEYQGFDLTASGSEGLPITFRAEGEVSIVGDSPDSAHAVRVEGSSHVVIEGFHVTGATTAGIAMYHCSDVTIRNNRADANGRWGIFTSFCDDVVIEGNETSRSAREHGIYTSNSGDRPIIRGNHSWGNSRAGIHMNGDVNFGGDGVISGALVEGNVIHDNGATGASGINCDGVEDSVFRNNLLHDNAATGIALYRIDGGRPSSRNLVVNNTIVMPAPSRWGVLIRDASTGNQLYNNIILNADAGKGAIDVSPDSRAGFESDYNVLEDRLASGSGTTSLADWQQDTGQDAHSLTALPDQLFADAFHLGAASPALDAGLDDIAPGTDADGRARPAGASVDIGAYELGGALPSGDEPGGGGSTGDGTGEDPGDGGGDGEDPDEGEPSTTGSGGCTTAGPITSDGVSLLLLLAMAAALARVRRPRSRLARRPCPARGPEPARRPRASVLVQHERAGLHPQHHRVALHHPAGSDPRRTASPER